jgi:VIT1/CCC1 family predicted Fe2+/Mn2+ transporter
MATGEYEGLEGSWHYKLRAGAVLGAFTLFGGLLPTIPFLFGQKTLAYVLALVLAWLLATGVWILKHEGLLGAVRTYLLLIVTTVVTALVPIVFT